MKRFAVVLYPNVNDYKTVVYADSVEEAIEIAQDEACINCYFLAIESNVTELEEN